MLRTLALLLFGSFALLFLVDFYLVYTCQIKMERAVEQALDGAIVEATQGGDHQRGVVRIEIGAADAAIRKIIAENLKLDSNLSNQYFSGSTISSGLEYVGQKPRLTCQLSSSVNLISGRMFGIENWPVTIKKHTPYLVEFI